MKEHIVQIFHKDTEKSDQAFLTNSNTLVKKQQTLFDDLWKIGIPLSARNKEFLSDKSRLQEELYRL